MTVDHDRRDERALGDGVDGTVEIGREWPKLPRSVRSSTVSANAEIWAVGDPIPTTEIVPSRRAHPRATDNVW